jgi:hypothetical protein
MPITRRQFDLGIDSEVEAVMKRVVDYLKGGRDQAFTPEELWEGCYGPRPPQSTVFYPVDERESYFFYALQRLVDLRVVEERVLGSAQYYAVGHVPLDVALRL